MLTVGTRLLASTCVTGLNPHSDPRDVERSQTANLRTLASVFEMLQSFVAISFGHIVTFYFLLNFSIPSRFSSLEASTRVPSFSSIQTAMNAWLL